MRVKLVMMPQMRRGSRLKKSSPKPYSPKAKAVPQMVKAIG